LDDYEEAIKAFNQAISSKPDCHEAWYWKGFALDDLSRYEEAIQAFDKVTDIKPDHHRTISRMARLWSGIIRSPNCLR